MLTLRELIDRQADNRRDDVFLSFNGTEIRFGELRTHVKAAAAALREAGVFPGQRVMVMMGNRPEHVIVYLALAWIGCVASEVSIHFKPSGIRIQLEDADPDIFLADGEYIGEVANAIDATRRTVPILTLSPDSSSRAIYVDCRKQVSDEVAPFIGTLDRVQAISYTSGTTGRPKGVVLSERFFQVGAKNAAILADVRSDDVLFLWEPFYHVAGWITVIIGLQHGVRIALVEKFSGSRCWDQIRSSGSTLLHYLGGAMNILLRQPQRIDDGENPVRIAWGAAAPAITWPEFERRFNVTIREGYGISEAQNFTHINVDGRVGSIGRPVEEFESWIATEQGTVLPPRMTGEIVLKPKVAGIIMSGYFRDDVKTAQVLRDGCVYTGDLGYVDEEGFFYYAGRKKDSLRRRGENVSAWEVERVVNAHPAVEESAVIGVASDMGEQDIRVFIRTARGLHLDPLELIAWCERDLAYYQIPRYIDFVEQFPRGPTQRIQKSELPTSLDGSWDVERWRAQ